MAYCRFSSDDFDCDLYIYEHVQGGYTMHVAGNRVVIDRDALPGWPSKDIDLDNAPENEKADYFDQYARQYRALMEALDGCERVTIEDELAGETFKFDTPQEVVDFLREVMYVKGYKWPDYLIPDLLAIEVQE